MDFIVKAFNIGNVALLCVFALVYAYQLFFAILALVKKPTVKKGDKIHPLAVLVAARNEEKVIPYLIESLDAQDYPKESYRVFVVVDNCTDRTAEVARACGATVFERQDPEHIGKGYAMEFLLRSIDETEGTDAFDAYVVFDADNLAEPNFLTEINKVYDGGADVIVAYRNAKNYGDNWISAGHGLWFIREASTLNAARSILGQGCVLAGTGFLFSRRVKELHGGWPFHLLTEDAEFMIESSLAGYPTAYAPDAEFYDEQTSSLKISLRQRLRWAKGGIQVFRKYHKALLRSALGGNATSLEQFICIAPAYVMMTAAFVFDAVCVTAATVAGRFWEIAPVLFFLLASLSVCIVFFGSLTTFSQWKKIHAPGWKKILYIFTFIPFMLTYIPIALCALILPVSWKPIPHTSHKGLKEVKNKSVPR